LSVCSQQESFNYSNEYCCEFCQPWLIPHVANLSPDAYALAKEFRKAQTARETRLSFNDLRDRVNATMKTLRYDQTCNVEGPKATCRGPVLGLPAKTRSR
jgi:hypothetical protein